MSRVSPRVQELGAEVIAAAWACQSQREIRMEDSGTASPRWRGAGPQLRRAASAGWMVPPQGMEPLDGRISLPRRQRARGSVSAPFFLWALHTWLPGILPDDLIITVKRACEPVPSDAGGGGHTGPGQPSRPRRWRHQPPQPRRQGCRPWGCRRHRARAVLLGQPFLGSDVHTFWTC